MKTTANAITIPTILQVGKGAIDRIGSLIAAAGYDNLTLFFGAGIYPIVGERIITALKAARLNILHYYEHDDNQIDCLMNFAFSIPAYTQLIVGIGGGKVLDVAKYTGFLNDIPFISVPTSTSNDGFASSGCSLFINGRRRSVPAKMPLGIVVDIDVIKNAPEIFIHSGIGDLVSKITAVYDWEFEAKQGKTVINDFAAMIAKKSVNSVARMDIQSARALNIRDDFFLKELVDSLTLSGIAMEIAGNSAPASGSEHLISHGLDSLASKPQLHGIQVGVATYLMSLVQNHRQQRVRKFLTETGFFEQAAVLKMKAADFEKAIDLAPTIKPHRHTYIHIEENRALAKQLLREDGILKEVLD
ncbi:MAG: iron-containing alcohol dehydrogenase family protein [Firmicutes bacterium]|nr:iron-containing alcohol dehydrogenase family protein [Bacillota bacterium]